MKKHENLIGISLFIGMILSAFSYVWLMCWMSTQIGGDITKIIDFVIIVASGIIIFVKHESNYEDGWDFIWLIFGIAILAGGFAGAVVIDILPV